MSLKKFFRKNDDKSKMLEHKLHLATSNPEPIFDLNQCGLTDLPSGIYAQCRVYRKEKLALAENRLTTLPDNENNRLSDLSSTIKVLDVSFNDIAKLPSSIAVITNLREFYINNNKLTQLPDTLSQLLHLEILEARNNLFVEFPGILCHVKSLRKLDIRGNRRISSLPVNLPELVNLSQLHFDCDTVTFPPSNISVQGTQQVIAFLSQHYGGAMRSDISKPKSPVVEQKKNSVEEEDPKYNDAYRNFIEKKEGKRLDRIQWEQQMKSDHEQHAHIADKTQLKRKRLLNDLLKEQEMIGSDLHVLQEKKIKDKDSLISAISSLEDHSNHLIDSLTRWQGKRENQLKMLQELEDYNKELYLRQDDRVTLRKSVVLKSLEKMIAEGLMESCSSEGTRFAKLLQDKKISQDDIRHRIFAEESLQREAFALLQRDRDAQHKFITSQIKLVENELITLTQAEVKRKNFKLESRISDVKEQRTRLANLLASLISEKERREQELRARLIELQNFAENEYEDDNFWLVQYQKLLHHQPIDEQLVQLGLDRDKDLQAVLLSVDAERLEPFLFIFVSNNLTFEGLKNMNEKDLLKLGMEDYELAKDIVDIVKKQSNLCIPSAPAEETESESSSSNSTLEASAPPMNIFCEMECVVCMNAKSNVIFFPCGHVCCCEACCTTFNECPLCRESIAVKRAFFINFSL